MRSSLEINFKLEKTTVKRHCTVVELMRSMERIVLSSNLAPLPQLFHPHPPPLSATDDNYPALIQRTR